MTAITQNIKNIAVFLLVGILLFPLSSQFLHSVSHHYDVCEDQALHFHDHEKRSNVLDFIPNRILDFKSFVFEAQEIISIQKETSQYSFQLIDLNSSTCYLRGPPKSISLQFT